MEQEPTGLRWSRAFILPLALFLSFHVAGQFGIRATPFHLETITLRPVPKLLVGGDMQVSERISLGLDLLASWSVFTPGIHIQGEVVHPEYTGKYYLFRNSFGLQYRSQYFPGETFYLASTIGLRRVRMAVEPDVYHGEAGVLFRVPLPKETGTGLVFPAGLRVGARSELDELYHDVYISLGYLIGGGRRLLEAEYLDHRDRPNVVWISAGYCLGLAWRNNNRRK